MSAERDGRRVSNALTEARTVLSRAETALHTLQFSSDPAAPGIRDALKDAIDALEEFRRIGNGCPKCGAQGDVRQHVQPHPSPYIKVYTCQVPA